MSANLAQLTFFTQIGMDFKARATVPGEEVIGFEGRVYQAGDHYIATIDGGWWIGRGKTAKAATQKAIEAYAFETYAATYGVLR